MNILSVIRVLPLGLGRKFEKGVHTLLRCNVPKYRTLGAEPTVQSVQKNRFRFRFRVTVSVRARVRVRVR